MSKCRSCGADIIWIRTKNGKPHPVDPAKHYIIKGEGSATLVTEAGTFIRGEFVSVEEGANGEGYIDDHWDTFNDWKEDDDSCYHVTAWMPLPEGYQKIKEVKV